MTVYAAIAGLLAMMGGFVFYASLDNPELDKIEIDLFDVQVIDVNNIDNRATLEVMFLVKNPSEKTFTIPSISYDLYADGVLIGSGQYSTEDVAMPGRAAFYPGAEIPLKNMFYLTLTEQNAQQYNAIVNGEELDFSVNGMVVVESAWSLIEKEFKSN
ncbi:hypothetical protein C6988_05015 [Nitrosopumilus sp. b1]|nr:hypothetical protein [Nitrosopumilus sp. b1]KAF6243052.1 hypothetical protein C6988_05015 [Nitrosopumilus sp. b1]